jgi:hypothetical protein
VYFFYLSHLFFVTQERYDVHEKTKKIWCMKNMCIWAFFSSHFILGVKIFICHIFLSSHAKTVWHKKYMIVFSQKWY